MYCRDKLKEWYNDKKELAEKLEQVKKILEE